MQVAHKKEVGKSAGCAQKRSARVRVAHKAVDHGVAPERNSELRDVPQNSSRSCEKQVGKGISDLA